MNFGTRKARPSSFHFSFALSALTSLYLVYSQVEMRTLPSPFMAGHVGSLESRVERGHLSPAATAPILKLTRPWVLYRDAGVIMEIADYADQNGRNVDHRLIAELRSDRPMLRITALKTFLIRAPLA